MASIADSFHTGPRRIVWGRQRFRDVTKAARLNGAAGTTGVMGSNGNALYAAWEDI